MHSCCSIALATVFCTDSLTIDRTRLKHYAALRLYSSVLSVFPMSKKMSQAAAASYIVAFVVCRQCQYFENANRTRSPRFKHMTRVCAGICKHVHAASGETRLDANLDRFWYLPKLVTKKAKFSKLWCVQLLSSFLRRKGRIIVCASGGPSLVFFHVL